MIQLTVAPVRGDEPARAEPLLRDVSALASAGNPASLIAWGAAQPLVVTPDGVILAAASRLGSGRVVVLGHGGFVRTSDADSEVFGANAVAWLAGDDALRTPRGCRVYGLGDEIAQELQRRGATVERVEGRVNELDLAAIDVVIASPQAFRRAGRLDDLDAWLRAGGGLLVVETAWGVLQLNPDLTLDTLAANVLLEPAGVRFTGDAHSGDGPDGTYPVDRSLLAVASAEAALDVLAGEGLHDPGRDPERDPARDLRLAARVAGRAFAGVPLDAALLRAADRVAQGQRDRLDAAYRGMTEHRLTPKRDALARALIDLDARRAAELPAEQITAHASSVAFPGPVGAARSERAIVAIDPRVPGWHTTGLYVPPGEVVTVTVPAALVGIGAAVQIGGWRDPHQHEYRVRLKTALRRFPIDFAVTPVASAIGGPIYIDVPAAALPGLAGARDGGATQHVEVRGAAEAPHFRLGVTDLQAWRDEIRHRDAPWAELESAHIVLSLPSAVVRDLDRPDLVMEHWDRVHESMQSLEPRTRNHWADRPYRYVADVSVSWGYMYCPADAPLTIPVKEAAEMVRLENFDAEGPNELWGHYHEMGHAHQNPLWTDRATGEVTVNLFTVRALHLVNGYPLDSEATRSDPVTAWNTFDGHRRTGKPYEDVGGPFPRLQFYALLWHAFGFEAFETAFASIRAVPAEDHPRGETAERNVLLVHLSEAVGRNLAPYFGAWGIEVTDAARERVAKWPEWMPVAPESAR